ncbi:enoyl-CoA hydratase-related protein [Thermodesulfobacteriota bacterium]
MDYHEILYEKSDGIAVLTLNRPEVLNAIGQGMIREIVHVLDDVRHDETLCVLVVTGAGTAFSAGGNVKEIAQGKGLLEQGKEDITRTYREGIQKIPLAFNSLEVPSIAAVNGVAIGAGCDLACMCDMRVAGEKARFSEIFAALGLISGDGGSYYLQRAVGYARACELTFTCEMIDARKALEIGLVSEVTPPEMLMERVMELARQMADKPARTLRMAKRLLLMSRAKPLDEVLDQAAVYQGICHTMPEHREALERFFSRRK